MYQHRSGSDSPAELHVAAAVADQYGLRKIDVRKVPAGLQGHTGIRLPVRAVFVPVGTVVNGVDPASAGGDRFDHSMANLDVLLYISKRGGSAVLCTEDTKVFVVRCGRIVLTELKGATVSVFPFDGSSCNLTYEGLQYPLEKKDLSAGSSLMGVSNCIISDRAEIRVNIGCALVIVYTPKDMPAEPPQSEIQSRLPETEDKKDTEK